MPGPPKTPLHLRLLKGNPSKRPLRAEPAPDRGSQCPDAPDFLEGFASDEWHRLAEELWRLGLLRVTDVATFSAYCVTYARWRTAEDALAHMENDPAGKAVLMRIAARAAKDMVRLGAEFGLTPSSRARVGGGVARDAASKFDGLIPD